MSQLFPAWLNKLTTYCKFHTFATTISWSYPCRVLSGIRMNRLYTPMHKGEGIPRWAPSIPTSTPHCTQSHTCARQHRASQPLAGTRASSSPWSAEPWQVGAGQRRADLHQPGQGTMDDDSTSIPWHDFSFPQVHNSLLSLQFPKDSSYTWAFSEVTGDSSISPAAQIEHVSTSTPTTVIQ